MNKREIYFNKKKLGPVDFEKMPIDISNKLDIILDDFEDGNNKIVDGYETMTYSEFTIKRKCQSEMNTK